MTAIDAQAPTTCPIDHSQFQRKTAPVPSVSPSPIKQDSEGVWHITNYHIAKQILRSQDVSQAGFSAESISEIPSMTKPAVLFLEGKEHTMQRKQTARFFTPKRTLEYRQLMLDYADKIIARLQKNGRANLENMSMEMATLVAGQIVGLKSDNLPGLSRRIVRIISGEQVNMGWHPRDIWRLLVTQWNTLSFYLFDVRPAIQKQRANPGNNVIAHLLASGYKDMEILIECLTYASAGMATTREFICIAFMHLTENDALREQFLNSEDEKERHQILHEILRLEPVVSNLFRRAQVDIEIKHEEEAFTITKGDLINLNIHATNADESAVGSDPYQLCPARQRAARVPEPVMSFGDGNHRCPGAYVAIQETDIFLRKLFAVEGIRIESQPKFLRNEQIQSYELRNFIIAV